MSNFNVPVGYGLENYIESYSNPSGVTVGNTVTAAFFRRYLLQKAMSVFKWTLPETWSKPYFLYSLYCWGHIAVVETDKYGVICQGGTPSGRNVYYQPREYWIANPLLKGILRPVIDRDCVVFRMAEDWRGIMDLVCYYADYMALVSATMGGNILNSRLAYILAAKDTNSAKTLEKLFDKILSGQPVAIADKSLFDNEGKLSMQMLQQNVGSNYISNELLQTLTTLECKFNTAIGLPNANTDKRERLIKDEVNANNVETASLVSMWFDNWTATIDKAKAMFDGLDSLAVEWWAQPETEVADDAG